MSMQYPKVRSFKYYQNYFFTLMSAVINIFLVTMNMRDEHGESFVKIIFIKYIFREMTWERCDSAFDF